MKASYETIPENQVDPKIRQAVDLARRFALADLGLESLPIRFLRKLDPHGSDRKHHGSEVLQFGYIGNGSQWHGLADHNRQEVLLLIEHGSRPGDLAETLLHEARHFHQKAKGWQNVDIERDARQYAVEALAASLTFEGNRHTALQKTRKAPYRRSEPAGILFGDIDQQLADLKKTREESERKYGKKPAAGKLETRSLTATLEKRDAAAGSIGKIGGLFIPYNSRSQDLGFYEVIRPNAFTDENLQNGQVAALWNHDAGQVLGRVSAGTLRLRQDAAGVHGEIDLPDTQAGRDCLTLVKRGDVTQCSFAFKVLKDHWKRGTDGENIREVEKALLSEISVVSFPAYLSSSVGARAAQ